jgi:FKBP-type peptidyl-prolyl cis-trans isomerase FkpA
VTLRHCHQLFVSIGRVSAVGLLLAAVGCGSSSTTSPTSSAPYSQTDLVVGTGAQAGSGSRATVSYTGWLYDASRPNGKGTQFDSSASFAFVIGAGQVIKGWDQGVTGMRVGGQRRLVLPPDLAYGSAGAGSVIPPNATLVFDIGLLGVQ